LRLIRAQHVASSSSLPPISAIRTPRGAYARAAVEFAVWCEREDIRELADIEPIHVAAYIETLGLRLAAPSVKQHLAAIRMLFDWLVVGQVIAVNPASPVRGPQYSVKKGETAVLSASFVVWTELVLLRGPLPFKVPVRLTTKFPDD
jgi:Phage integrase, N-terminal SAM-like domain